MERHRTTEAQEEAQVERDVGLILHPLVEQHGISELYLEGNTLEEERAFQSTPESLAALQRTIRILQQALGNSPPDQKDRLAQQIKDFQSQEASILSAVNSELGGAAALFLDGKLKIRGSESEEHLARVMDLAKKATPRESPEWIEANEKRETAIIDSLHQRDVRYALLRFGYSHNFWDTIQRRNAKHPDYRFCLIEVVPSAVEKIQSRK